MKRRTLNYILDDNGDPVPCDDILQWGQWFETSGAARRIADDKDEGPDATPIRVSTVFLGLDHQFGIGPPVLWETLVFGGALDGAMMRYTSKADALRGHQAMCRRVKASLTRGRPDDGR